MLAVVGETQGPCRDGKISVEEAFSLIRDELSPLRSEAVPVIEALGWPLAAPAIAAIDMPRFDASAMDGYAVRSSDTSGGPTLLPLTAAIPAGTWPEPLESGSACPIATGAPVPSGADAVIPREKCVLATLSGQRFLSLQSPVLPGQNVRPRGEDAATGDEIVPVGFVISPDAVGALISYGIQNVVIRRPRIGILSTGCELVGERAQLTNDAQIIDSNGPMMQAFCRHLGMPTETIGRARDNAASLDENLSDLLSPKKADVLISTGGVSAGTLDLISERLIRQGARVVFHGVRMRPGKPLLFAILPDGRPFFGLPGNPVAALVGFRFFVLAALRRLAGLDEEIGRPVRANVAPREGTTLFLKGRSQPGSDADFVDTRLNQRSHIQRSVLDADRWVRVDPDGGILSYPKLGSLTSLNGAY